MAKGKKNRSKVTRKMKSVKRNVTSFAKGFLGLDDSAQKAMAMLADPCNAALEPGCYRGDQGYKSRFVQNGSILFSAGIVAGAVAYIPGANLLYTIDWTSALAPTAWVNNSVSYAPGQPFIATNATALRSLGACVSCTPLSANLSTSGVVYSGIVTVQSLGIAATWTPQQLAQLVPNFGKVSIDTPMECKFVPSSSDEEYNRQGTLTDNTDSSAILFVFIGLPAATGLSMRITQCCEWKPVANIGIASNSVLGNPSKNTIEHVKEALRARDAHGTPM